MKTHMDSCRISLLVWTSLLLLCALFLAACGGPSTPTVTPTPGKTVTPTTGVTPTTVPMPPTQTSCPPAGTARGAVMAPLVRGSHTNVVYVSNQGPQANPISGTLKRYDIATKSETVIVTLLHTSINDAQVSADGQWVLFSASVANRSAFQLIRMDGQGLQTLYCAASGVQSGALEWSPDQKFLAFAEGVNIYLLNVATGTYQLEVPPNNNVYYVPRTWLDNTRLYMSGLLKGTETPPLHLYLLDISSAKVQQVLNSPTLCGDFDSSIDSTQLFTSECVFRMPVTEGPSSIRVQPATGGPARTIYSTPTYAITNLRVASHSTLLFVIRNENLVLGADRSHNGLWKVNTDGSGLTRLTTQTAGEITGFNAYTQYVWSTVSRDGTFYAVQVTIFSSSTDLSFSILIGPMNGGAPFTLAKGTTHTGTVDIAGWTTM